MADNLLPARCLNERNAAAPDCSSVNPTPWATSMSKPLSRFTEMAEPERLMLCAAVTTPVQLQAPALSVHAAWASCAVIARKAPERIPASAADESSTADVLPSDGAQLATSPSSFVRRPPRSWEAAGLRPDALCG